jgi:ribosomal RNA-processing protein 8
MTKKDFTNSTYVVIADFGCGEAKLAEKIACDSSASTRQKKFVVHSLDLVSNGNPRITPCDMANTPLKTASVDIGVFCLSLMGTNVADFVREAYRVIKPNGFLKIAEVRSRFEEGSNNMKTICHDESLLQRFLDSMLQLGFRCTSKNQSNVMFIILEFCKMNQEPDPNVTFSLKPCIYKRR